MSPIKQALGFIISIPVQLAYIVWDAITGRGKPR